MDKRKNAILLSILIILLLGNFAQATSISFVDAAYISNGTLSVTSPSGDPIILFQNSSQVLEVNNETAYMLDYQPGGLFALHDEVLFSMNDGNFTAPELNGARFYLAYFSEQQNLVMLIWLFILLGLVLFI